MDIVNSPRKTSFLWDVHFSVQGHLFLHRLFVAEAHKNSDRAFGLLQKMHWVLLTLSLVAIVGAVAGTRGYLRF